jgi:hypothetical protein
MSNASTTVAALFGIAAIVALFYYGKNDAKSLVLAPAPAPQVRVVIVPVYELAPFAYREAATVTVPKARPRRRHLAVCMAKAQVK